MRTRRYTLAEVTAMYEAALARRSPEDLAATGADLGALAASEALRNQREGRIDVLAGSGFDVITNPATRHSFETAYDAHVQFFNYIGISMPDSDQFTESGIDFAHLANEYERMENEGLEPQVVMALQGLGANSWKSLYVELQNDSAVNHDGRIKNGGLYLDSRIAENWNKFDQIPDAVPSVLYDGVGAHTTRAGWTIRLIPGTEGPTNTDVNHNANDAIHPTIAEYLSLQAVRLQAEQPPIDPNTLTWLNGTFDNGRAPGGFWRSGYGQVYVFWYRASLSDGFLGVRLPVW